MKKIQIISVSIVLTAMFMLGNFIALVNSYNGTVGSTYENILTRDTAGPLFVVSLVALSVLIRKFQRHA